MKSKVRLKDNWKALYKRQKEMYDRLFKEYEIAAQVSIDRARNLNQTRENLQNIVNQLSEANAVIQRKDLWVEGLLGSLAVSQMDLRKMAKERRESKNYGKDDLALASSDISHGPSCNSNYASTKEQEEKRRKDWIEDRLPKK